MAAAITKFDKAAAVMVGTEVAKAVEEIARKYGLRVKPHGGTYDAEGFWWRTTVELEATAADGETAEMRAWKKYAKPLDGLETEWLGTTVTLGDRTMKIEGLLMGREKNVVKLVDVTGKSYVAPARAVNDAKRWEAVRQASGKNGQGKLPAWGDPKK